MSSVWSVGKLLSGAKSENIDQMLRLFLKVKNIDGLVLNVYLGSFIWLSTYTSAVIPVSAKI